VGLETERGQEKNRRFPSAVESLFGFEHDVQETVYLGDTESRIVVRTVPDLMATIERRPLYTGPLTPVGVDVRRVTARGFDDLIRNMKRIDGRHRRYQAPR
jgi:hypothetical protein